MRTRVVHQTRLVLIACLITFGLSGISYAQKNGHPPWVWSVAYSPDGGTLASGVPTRRYAFGTWRREPSSPHSAGIRTRFIV